MKEKTVDVLRFAMLLKLFHIMFFLTGLFLLTPWFAFAQEKTKNKVAPAKEILCIFTGGNKGRLEANEDGTGGIVRKATLLEKFYQEAKKGKKFWLALDSGSTLAPDYLSRINKGRLMLEHLRNAHYTAMAVSNQEFAFGQSYFLDLVEGRKGVVVLAANVLKGKKRLTPLAIVKSWDGINIGVFGLTSPRIISKVSGYDLKGLKIEPVAKHAKAAIEYLQKKKCDLILCVGFLTSTEAHVLGNQFPQIDVIIRSYQASLPPSAVQDIQITSSLKNPIVVAPQQHNKYVGLLKMRLQKGMGRFQLNSVRIEYSPVNSSIPPHIPTQKSLDKLKKEVAKLSKIAVFPFSPSEVLPIKFNTVEFAKLMGAIIRQQLNTEIAILNLKNFDSKVFESFRQNKNITYLDLQKIFRAKGNIVRLTLKGSDIVNIHKNIKPDEPLVFVGLEKKKDGYFINGVPLRADDHYWVATNQYLASGNTGYPQFKNKLKEQSRFLIQPDLSFRISPKGLNIPLQEAFNTFSLQTLKQVGRSSYAIKSTFIEILERKDPLYLIVFDNIRLTYSETSASVSSQLASLVNDTRASAQNEQTTRLAGTLRFIRHVPWWLMDNTVRFAYAQTKVEGQPRNTSEDDLVIETDNLFIGYGFQLTEQHHLVPFINLKFDTELEKDENKNQQKLLFFSLGASAVSPGPLTKLKFGAVGRADFSDTNNPTIQFGLLTELSFKKVFLGTFAFESNLLGYYFPDQSEDKPGDLRIRVEWGNILKVPFFKDFFFIVEFRLYTFQEKSTDKFGTHTSISLGITYYRAWKFLYESLF
ncbi:MAG: hypothetical protein D6805_03890 [Planctomycetota bacterium]|nr:MAG: hypothetical protein D6805_03890 [Planctomycetota bacterium]